MSTQKKSKIKLSKIKGAGIAIPISLRKANLTKDDIKLINKTYANYEEIIFEPEEYQRKNISHITPYRRQILIDKGYRIQGNILFVNKQGKKHISVKQVFSKSGGYGIEILRTDDGAKKSDQVEFLKRTKKGEEWQSRLISEYNQIKFKENEYIGIKFYDGRVWRTKVVGINDMLKYISDVAESIRGNVYKDELKNNTHIVKIIVDDYRDLAFGEKTTSDFYKGKRAERKVRRNRFSKVNKTGRNS